MHQISQNNLKRVQSLKFFNILKQTQPSGLSACFNPAFLNSIYKQLNRLTNAQYNNDKKINEQLFAQLFSQYYQPSLSSINDLIAFYRGIKEVFKGEYKSQNELFDLNKDIFLSKFDSQSLENYLTQISILGQEIRMSSIGSYQEMIMKFNYLFMIYYLYKQKFADEFYQNYRIFVKKEDKNHFTNEYLQIYIIFMKKEIVQAILREIRQIHYEDEAYKSLLFVCDASLAFAQIFALFLQSTCFQKDSWDIFIASLNRFSRQDDSKFGGVSLIAFLNVFMRIKPDFIPQILTYLIKDNNNSILLQKSQRLIQNISYTRQIIEFYTFLLRVNRYQIIGPNMIIEIQFYAVKVLNSNQAVLFCPSILLINETIKYNVQNDAIMIILQALQANDPQINISALKSVESALSVNHNQILETLFIRRTKYFPIFIKFISVSIEQPFSCHCLVLQILYLMVRADFYSCFNDILRCLEVAMQVNLLFATFVSEILKKICQIISQDQIYARKVSPELILNLTQRLISTSICQDICSQKILQFDQKFVNRQAIENSLHVLIFFFQNEWCVKEVQKNSNLHEIIYNLYLKLGAFVAQAGTQKAVMQILKQEIVINSRFFHKRIYGFIFSICENIIFSLAQASNNAKLNMKDFRQSFFRLYNQYLTVQQMNMQKIPIYIDYKIGFVLFKQEYVRRFLQMSISYQKFERYCIQILEFCIQKQKFHHPIQNVSLKDVQYRLNIRDQSSFRDMLNRYISKKIFTIQVLIQIETVPSNSYEAFPITQINPFHASNSSFQSIRSSPRDRGSQNLAQSRGSSRSPLRLNAVSRIIPNPNSRISQQTTNISPQQSTISSNISRVVQNQIGQCELCRQPSYLRFCERCNRR